MNPKFIKSFVFVLIAFVIIGYSLYEARNLIAGPIIEITTPANGSLQRDALVEIAGTVKNVSDIALNDRKITMNTEGKFSEKMLLSPGYNIIKLTVTDSFGREKEELLELMYNEQKTIGRAEGIEIN
jgi:hypothetical protein